MPMTRFDDSSNVTHDPHVDHLGFAADCEAFESEFEAYSKYGPIGQLLPVVYCVQEGSGGGGSGTSSDPYTLSTDIDDAWTQYAARVTAALSAHSATGFDLVTIGEGLEIRRPPSGTLDLSVDYAHLRCSLDGGAKSLVHTYDQIENYTTDNPAIVGVGGWTDNADGSYTLGNFTADIGDVMLRKPTAAIDNDLDVYNTRAMHHATSAANAITIAEDSAVPSPACYYNAAANTLTIALPGGEAPTAYDIWVSSNNTVGFAKTTAQGTAISGFGLVGGDFNNTTYMVINQGDDTMLVRDCTMARVFDHVSGTAGNATYGSSFMVYNCAIHGGPSDNAGYSQGVCYTNTAGTAGNEPEYFEGRCQYRGAGAYGRWTGTPGYVGQMVRMHSGAAGSLGACVIWGGNHLNTAYAGLFSAITPENIAAGNSVEVVTTTSVQDTRQQVCPIRFKAVSGDHGNLWDWTARTYPTVGTSAVQDIRGATVNDKRSNSIYYWRVPELADADRCRAARIDSTTDFTNDWKNLGLYFDHPGSGVTTRALQLFQVNSVPSAGTGTIHECIVSDLNDTGLVVLETATLFNDDPGSSDFGCKNTAFMGSAFTTGSMADPITSIDPGDFDPDALPLLTSDLVIDKALLTDVDDYPEWDYADRRRTLNAVTVGPRTAALPRERRDRGRDR